MPQALDEQRELMTKWFGDFDLAGPLVFLMSHGFTEHAGIIRPPVPSHRLSGDEAECLDFLFAEWDFGFERP